MAELLTPRRCLTAGIFSLNIELIDLLSRAIGSVYAVEIWPDWARLQEVVRRERPDILILDARSVQSAEAGRDWHAGLIAKVGYLKGANPGMEVIVWFESALADEVRSSGRILAPNFQSLEGEPNGEKLLDVIEDLLAPAHYCR